MPIAASTPIFYIRAAIRCPQNALKRKPAECNAPRCYACGSTYSAFVFDLEIFVVGTEDGNTLDQAENAGDVGPAEENIQDTLSALAKIELVNTQTAKNQGQNCCNNLIFDGPVGTLRIYVALLLHIYDLLRLCLGSGLCDGSAAIFTFGSTLACRGTTLRT